MSNRVGPPTKPRRKLPTQTPIKQTPGKQKPKDPVEVYCRIRPLKEDENDSCIEVLSDNTLQLMPPAACRATHATRHIFKHIFGEKATQETIFDQIALPLAKDLIQGKNGLLFAYGVSNSGKTYTMAGENHQPGILPRVMDVLFNSISEVQAPKYVFRPNTTNGFNVFSEAEAKVEQSRNRPKKVSPRQRQEMAEFGQMMRVSEKQKVNVIDEDNSYAVFVSYIEIYNSYIYDLLEQPDTDAGIHPKPPQSRNMREDINHNMYVSGVTEVEVKSMEEAYEVMLEGQRRRHVAQTELNHDSSRSHAVFNIRLVQAPLDPSGVEALQDPSKIITSQLSLVDLAGSERMSRTQTGGDRVKEAGNINQSLMALRQCMETLRDNQRNGVNKIVPYRDSKLTHLFKNYFDGEGKVRMIVCVSPEAADYDESIHVMRFAEVTQEVTVDRPEAVKINVGLAPGRRRANMIYKAAIKEVGSIAEANGTAPPVVHPYQVALGMIYLQQYISESSIVGLTELKQFLENRAKTREQLVQDLKKKQLAFREVLVAAEQELVELRIKMKDYQVNQSSREKAQRETSRLKGIINSQEKQIAQLTSSADSYKTQLEDKNKEIAQLTEENSRISQENGYLLRSKQKVEGRLNSQVKETEQQLTERNKIKRQLQGRVAQEKERLEQLSKVMEKKSQECDIKDKKLRQVRTLLENSPLACEPRSITSSVHSKRAAKENRTEPGTAPLYNKGRKRSLSENWIEHNPADSVYNGEIMKPTLKKKRTVTNPKPKHFSSKASKYVLKHQEQDSEGEVKTELYKAEILPTRMGGASVKFTDVEKLHHNSPKTTRRVTRSMTRRTLSTSSSAISDSSSMEEWTDVETRCAVGIEGKPGANPAFCHITAKRPHH